MYLFAETSTPALDLAAPSSRDVTQQITGYSWPFAYSALSPYTTTYCQLVFATVFDILLLRSVKYKTYHLPIYGYFHIYLSHIFTHNA